MKTQIYNLYKGLMTRFGDIYFATEPPECRALQIEILMEVIDAGQIICRGYDPYLDGYFIPGDYSHSGVVLNKREMLHSIAEGVKPIHPIDFVMHCDRFIILQPPYSPVNEVRELEIGKVVDRAIWHNEANQTEYDFTFCEDGKYYCHEFTADCLSQVGIDVPRTTKRFGVWPIRFYRELYLAQNIIDVCKVVFEFNPKKGRGLKYVR